MRIIIENMSSNNEECDRTKCITEVAGEKEASGGGEEKQEGVNEEVVVLSSSPAPTESAPPQSEDGDTALRQR